MKPTLFFALTLWCVFVAAADFARGLYAWGVLGAVGALFAFNVFVIAALWKRSP